MNWTTFINCILVLLCFIEAARVGFGVEVYNTKESITSRVLVCLLLVFMGLTFLITEV